MYKYEMTINGTKYNALFTDHFEAADFLDENDRNGDITIITSTKPMSAQDILADDDFEWSYRVEMASTIIIPDFHSLKWEEQETELKRLGYIA